MGNKVNIAVAFVRSCAGVCMLLVPFFLSPGNLKWPNGIHHVRDSAEIRPVVSPRPAREPQELTQETYNRLNNLPPPKPTGYFTMDGNLDTSAVLLASNGMIKLYGAVRGSQLYVATNSARSQKADMFIFVSVAPGELHDAPLGKTGRVAAWSAFLGDRCADSSAHWYDASASAFVSVVDEKVGTVLEGVVDFELLTGITPAALYLAVGKYQQGNGGRLVTKLPVGKHNGNISSKELYKLTVPGTN